MILTDSIKKLDEIGATVTGFDEDFSHRDPETILNLKKIYLLKTSGLYPIINQLSLNRTLPKETLEIAAQKIAEILSSILSKELPPEKIEPKRERQFHKIGKLPDLKDQLKKVNHLLKRTKILPTTKEDVLKLIDFRGRLLWKRVEITGEITKEAVDAEATIRKAVKIALAEKAVKPRKELEPRPEPFHMKAATWISRHPKETAASIVGTIALTYLFPKHMIANFIGFASFYWFYNQDPMVPPKKVL